MTTVSVDKKATVTRADQLPLIAIVGPTASGKSAVAMRLATQFKCEIICADSRTVYQGTDIGTAKPSREDQAAVPHWGLDLVEPGQSFTAADFKKYTNQKVAEIRSRGAVPLLVGGTGLYVDGVMFDYQFGDPNPELRSQLEGLSLAELRDYCAANNVSVPENDQNKRHLIRAIEQGGLNNRRRQQPIDNSVIVGIATDREELRQRITDRTDELFAAGVVEEATNLAAQYGWDSEAMTGNIYPLVRRYQQGELSLEELKQKFITSDWRLAKRQLTWLRRNEHINWQGRDEAHNFLVQYLNSPSEQ